MSRRPAPEPLSPRALARLRASPRSYVPTALDLDLDGAGAGRSVDPGDEPAGRWAHGGSDAALDDDVGHRGGRHTRTPRPRAWVRLPAAFVGARWQPGRAALVGVVIVAALAAAVFGLRVAWAQSAGGGTVIAPGGGSRAGPTGVTAGAVPVGVTGASELADGGRDGHVDRRGWCAPGIQRRARGRRGGGARRRAGAPAGAAAPASWGRGWPMPSTPRAAPPRRPTSRGSTWRGCSSTASRCGCPRPASRSTRSRDPARAGERAPAARRPARRVARSR